MIKVQLNCGDKHHWDISVYDAGRYTLMHCLDCSAISETHIYKDENEYTSRRKAV